MVAGEDWDFLETNHECIEVIGNIHDNQEMLKGGEGRRAGEEDKHEP